MIVKELIKELQKWDPNMEVRIEDCQWAAPIKKITRDVYYTDSDGEWYCGDEVKEEGLTKKRIIVVLQHQ